MDDRINRIEDKVDKIVEKLSETNIILASQHESLVQHIKRSDMLEAKMEPIEKHVNMVSGVIKFITILGAGAGTITAILKLIKVI